MACGWSDYLHSHAHVATEEVNCTLTQKIFCGFLPQGLRLGLDECTHERADGPTPLKSVDFFEALCLVFFLGFFFALILGPLLCMVRLLLLSVAV